MWQAQWKIAEREERRKSQFPDRLILGHIVKNYMTVILLFRQMGGYQGFIILKARVGFAVYQNL